jgi:hypothetical protein
MYEHEASCSEGVEAMISGGYDQKVEPFWPSTSNADTPQNITQRDHR